ncbi:ATP-binding cassette domain-containing protein, partial [Paraburkholderia sp. SIMBA_053]|uniref:ATP-binding cassette domain-containing protein n=1 Tax=Paraburkholderia sp. SIMBA_053 TaxID=3085794 RepID=UPI0039795514
SGALVRDVSFSLGAGERLGLIGESGSGKSLTSLAVTGLLPDALVASGSVLLDGHQVVGARDADLRPLRGPVAQIVFQEPLTALDPLMR